ncbi:hypothetical protein ACA910_017008 [Epithemia clementina (nom. ined.)]
MPTKNVSTDDQAVTNSPRHEKEEEVVVIVKTPPRLKETIEESDETPIRLNTKQSDFLARRGGGDIETTISSPHLQSQGQQHEKAPYDDDDDDNAEALKSPNSLGDTTEQRDRKVEHGNTTLSSGTIADRERALSDSIRSRQSSFVDEKHRIRSNGRKWTHTVRTPLVQDLGHVDMANGRGRHVHKIPPAQRKKLKEKKLLPPHQYETTLIRRAIRKGDHVHANMENETSNANTDSTIDDLYGDVSLGMQLAPVEGKIIVQGLIPLKDGRASPAQLSGCIQRGDVLLQINDRSLVNIPFDQLMLSLTPLSSPLADGTYPRRITLRFAAGQGLELIKRKELEDQSALRQRKALTAPISPGHGGSSTTSDQNAATGGNIDGAADILGLFTMVDHMSGMPMILDDAEFNGNKRPAPVALVEQQHPDADETLHVDKPVKAPTPPIVESSLPGQLLPHHPAVSLEEVISCLVARERNAERDESNSEFFSWNDSFSILLRKPQSTKAQTNYVHGSTKFNNGDNMATSDLLELGHQAFHGAEKLSAILEKIDRGWSDRRSVRSLSATLSLYSRASTRRRYVLDGKAMPVNFEKVQEDDERSVMGTSDSHDQGASTGSNENEEELDNDKLMIQLAAQDDIWRKQVIEFLVDVVEKLTNPDEKKNNNDDASQAEQEQNTSSAVSTELGSFLFGEGMTKALMLHKKPQALPPDEITALLFDMANNVSATVPDQIQVVSSKTNVRSSLVPFAGTTPPAANSDVVLAARFLLDDVLPVWLQTFRPLPWTQRRVLWPLERSVSTESTTLGSTRSDDSITVDSMNTRQQRSTAKRKPANLREQIENQELNVETRSETCFLVTYYFAQKLLPELLSNDMNGSSLNEPALAAAKSFVTDYGAYLRLHTCLAYAAALQAQDLVTLLVEIAKHDPQHRESMRRFSRAGSLLFYEPSTLSAVVARLHNLRMDNDQDQRLVTIQLCASAYPDVQPWQVHRECQDANQFLYYKYLSYLLHPSDGHEGARHDSTLVLEWSGLSALGYLGSSQTSHLSYDAQERKRNFCSVVSKTSSDHLAYTRDLPALLRLAVEVKEYLLALDLVTEMFDDSSDKKSQFSFDTLISTLRQIGCAAVESFDANDTAANRNLKRIIRLFEKTNGTEPGREGWIVDGSAEIMVLLDHASKSFGKSDRQKLIPLVNFFAKEASPKELLQALAKWSSTAPRLGSHLYEVLRTVLRRGAHDNQSVVELSKSLQHVREARMGVANSDSARNGTVEERSTSNNNSAVSGLWKRIFRGTLSLVK